MAALPHRRAMAYFALFTLVWVTLEEELGTLFQQRHDLTQIVWSRYGTHLLLILLLFGRRGRRRPWQTDRPVFQLLRSGCMVVMPLAFIVALKQGLAVDAVWAVFWVAPLLVLGLARCWPQDGASRAPWQAWALCGLCTAAAAGMLWPAGMPLRAGTIAVLVLAAGAMSLSFAIYVVMTRSLRDHDVPTNLFFSGLGPFLVLTPFVLPHWSMPTMHDALIMASIGALGLVALWALDRGTAAAPLPLSAPALYAYVPLLAAIDGPQHGSSFAHREWLASGAICLALAGAWWRLDKSPVAAR